MEFSDETIGRLMNDVKWSPLMWDSGAPDGLHCTHTGEIKIGESMTVRVLIMREGEVYVAQGIDMDIAAQAKTIEDLKSEFIRVFVGTVEGYRKIGVDAFKVVPKAPKQFEALAGLRR